MRATTVGDQRAMKIAQDLNNGTLVAISKIVTALGALPVTGSVAIVMTFLLIARRRIAEGLAVASGMALTVWAVHWAKGAVDRPRPDHPLVSSVDQSYPSGHSAYAIIYIVAAVVVGRMYPTWKGRFAIMGAAIALVALIGATRIYLRAHYFSDVIGGYGLAVGIFSVTGIVALVVSQLRQNGPATS
jgi:undecaprenyl-diphosphatase